MNRHQKVSALKRNFRRCICGPLFAEQLTGGGVANLRARWAPVHGDREARRRVAVEVRCNELGVAGVRTGDSVDPGAVRRPGATGDAFPALRHVVLNRRGYSPGVAKNLGHG